MENESPLKEKYTKYLNAIQLMEDARIFGGDSPNLIWWGISNSNGKYFEIIANPLKKDQVKLIPTLEELRYLQKGLKEYLTSVDYYLDNPKPSGEVQTEQ
jgi:hypothetical protein